MCLLVVFVMWISPEPHFFFSLSLFYLSSASPSAGVSNIEIRKITMHEETYSATRDKISAKRMHKILTHLRCRELADDDRPAHIKTDCHENLK